jgi:hypothetical protein
LAQKKKVHHRPISEKQTKEKEEIPSVHAISLISTAGSGATATDSESAPDSVHKLGDLASVSTHKEENEKENQAINHSH